MDVAYIILGAGAIMGMLIHRSIVSRIREHHRQVWEALGSPSFPDNYSIKTNLRVRKFLRSRECHDLGDSVLASRIRNERRFGLFYALVLIALFLSVVLL